MRENLSRFRGFSEANNDEKRINVIISAVSDPSNPGSSIYLYENANLTDAQFEPVSKPSPPIVKNVLDQTVSLKLQKSPSGVTVHTLFLYTTGKVTLLISGVTLWDKKSLSEDLDSHPQLLTDLKFSSSDSLSSKSSLLDVSASLKASFLGGLVEVGGSAKYLCDTKSSNQQSRVTMYYSETSRFDQLTMTQLGKITYPQVFDQKTATHAFMVFDQMSSKDEKKQEIEGKLHVMVRKLPGFSIEGEGSVNMTEDEKKIAENITCIFHGDFHLEQNPTTYTEALNLYKRLPTVLKENPQNAVPLKVWLYPLHLLDIKAAKLEREISTNLVSNTEDIMEELGEVQRTCNDLSRITMVNAFSDLEDRLHSFQDSFSIYKTVLQKALARVLPAIRGGGEEQQSLEDILKIHYSSPFNADKLNQWLHDAKSELHLLNSQTKTLEQIRIEDSDGLNTILLDPDIDAVVCLTFTSLKYEDPYLSTLKEFLTCDMFKELDGNKMLFVASGRKWFNTPDVIKKMRENLSRFRGFSEANNDEKRINVIISAVSDPSNPGSSIYLIVGKVGVSEASDTVSTIPSSGKCHLHIFM
uniref:SNTX thioredoxin-like domain-containing protein n=1 Tax=Sinocyclocheilus grahami TaxID=75366 RepID=A0A672TDA6_SINGR